MKRGSVWWVDLGKRVGTEIKKIRPAVVVSNNSANTYLQQIQVVPLTSNVSNVFSSEAPVILNGKKGKALAHQLTTISKKRLVRHIGQVRPSEMIRIEEAIRIQLSL